MQMKTYLAYIPYDAKEALRRQERRGFMPHHHLTLATALLAAWFNQLCRVTEPGPVRWQLLMTHGAYFLFNCGREYGIAQERARVRARSGAPEKVL